LAERIRTSTIDRPMATNRAWTTPTTTTPMSVTVAITTWTVRP
jgi:hypothetical protein